MNSRMMYKVTLIMMFVLLAACNKLSTQKKMTNLEESLTSYEVALRWAQHQDAYSYHVSPNGTQPPVNMDRLQEISVTGIDISDKVVNEDQTEAYVKGVIRYFNKNQGTEKKLKLEQKWWYSEENKQWYIDAEFPSFE